MDTIELSDPQQDALTRLTRAAADYPEADGFEHNDSAVVMPGARHDVQLPIDRETLRSLGQRKLVRFTRERDAFGHGRWTFVLTPQSADYV